MSHYVAEERLRQKVHRGLECVSRVLSTERSVGLGGDVGHSYGDKFGLAEFVLQGGCGAALNALEGLGLQREGLAKAAEWSKARRVTLRAWREESCRFVEKKTREVSSGTHEARLGGLLKVKQKTVTTVEEYTWEVTGRWGVDAFPGTDRETKVALTGCEKGTARVTTMAEKAPRAERSMREGMELDVSWLLQQLNGELEVALGIDRGAEGCHTPRRNAEAEAGLAFFRALRAWCAEVRSYFEDDVFRVKSDHGLDLSYLRQGADVFVPVIPLLDREARRSEAGGNPSQLVSRAGTEEASRTLTAGDLEAFLAEERRTLAEKREGVERAFAQGTGGLVTATEGVLVAVLRHVEEVAECVELGLDYIEGLLREQLVAALGREVTSHDFGNYMRFHNRKLFREEVVPREFCYAVRRAGRDPEGVVSLEGQGEDAGGLPQPVLTIVRKVAAQAGEQQPQMRFALNAAAEVRFGGDRYVHAYVGHRFSTEAVAPLALVARARQFSSYVLLLGRIGGADLFLPEHALLVRNKDEVRIPLDLEQIPTPQEFEDAIESLSPEQQRFARAYRSMQMEATLFGVCVVQVKPQLERVLNLPQGALTKEIELSEDLMQLFLEYQISSDLLSFQADPRDDEAAIPVKQKVEAVRQRVEAMNSIIKEAKEAILEEQRRIAEKKRLEEEAIRRALEEKKRKEQEEMGAVRRRNARLEAIERLDALVDKSCDLSDRSNVFMMRAKAVKKSNTGFLSGLFSGGKAPASRPSHSTRPVCDAAPACEIAPVCEAAPISQELVVDLPVEQTKAEEVIEPEAPEEVVEEAPDEPEPEDNEVHDADGEKGGEGVGDDAYDISNLPPKLEAKYKEYDEDNCLRPTIIKTGKEWMRSAQESLLSTAVSSPLGAEAQRAERNKAFDLIDALTRSGGLPLEEAALHVVVAATHCFDLTLLDTVVQRSVNPIEKVERSALIAASVVHDVHPSELVRGGQLKRVAAHAEKLMRAE